MKTSIKEVWDNTLTNLRRYKDEFTAMWTGMREEHLPRFKKGSFDPREDENYYHLVRNLFTELFRAMPRTISGLFIIWLLVRAFHIIF